MILEAQVTINGSREAIWATITDIENCADTISGIESVEVLERPADGFAGLKWRETRTFMGKTATEVMWITDAVENQSYEAGAASHGCSYKSTFSIAGQGDSNTLTMTHASTAESVAAKLMSIPMGLMFKGAMKKAILQDLNDIKAAVERQNGEGAAGR